MKNNRQYVCSFELYTFNMIKGATCNNRTHNKIKDIEKSTNNEWNRNMSKDSAINN